MTESHDHKELPDDMDATQFLEWFSLFFGSSSAQVTLPAGLGEDLGFDSIELFELAVVLSGDDANAAILQMETVRDAFNLYVRNCCRSERLDR